MEERKVCEKVETKEVHVVLDEATKRIKKLESLLRDCRNELCYRCGQYHESHLGACDGCRWKDEWRG